LSFPCNQIRANQLTGPHTGSGRPDDRGRKKCSPARVGLGQGLTSLPTAGHAKSNRPRGIRAIPGQPRPVTVLGAPSANLKPRVQGMDTPPSWRRR
jgi:hypothetical protein